MEKDSPSSLYKIPPNCCILICFKKQNLKAANSFSNLRRKLAVMMLERLGQHGLHAWLRVGERKQYGHLQFWVYCLRCFWSSFHNGKRSYTVVAVIWQKISEWNASKDNQRQPHILTINQDDDRIVWLAFPSWLADLIYRATNVGLIMALCS